jgi:hypothetical protein
MSVLPRNGVSLLLAATLAVLSTPSQADELLLMPYSCAVVGGQTVLTPSQDEGYRIIGHREQRKFVACSPINPANCRQWTIHRFDLDCGGVRVPWVSVVAAADAQRRGRAWITNGHLQVQMPPGWNMPADDPCARPFGYDDRWPYGGLARYCSDRRSLGPPPTVEMPAGFAPMLGIDGVFVAATAPNPPARDANPAPLPAPSTPPSTAPARIARNEPMHPPPQNAHEAAKEVSANKHIASAAEPEAAVPHSAPSVGKAPDGPIIPKIINRVEPAQSEPPPFTPKLALLSKTATHNRATEDTDPPMGPVAAPMPAKGGLAQDQSPTAIDTKSIPVSVVGAVRSNALIVMVAIGGGLAMLVMTAFAFHRQRERALSGVASRDIAAHSLEGEPIRNLPAIASYSAPEEPADTALQPTWGDAIPRTRAEALQVLGMGVTPQTTDAAIKKIVDGLRQSWHPDHANGPADRQVRELRIKQINAAWEIIMGKRAHA